MLHRQTSSWRAFQIVPPRSFLHRSKIHSPRRQVTATPAMSDSAANCREMHSRHQTKLLPSCRPHAICNNQKAKLSRKRLIHIPYFFPLVFCSRHNKWIVASFDSVRAAKGDRFHKSNHCQSTFHIVFIAFIVDGSQQHLWVVIWRRGTARSARSSKISLWRR